LNVVQNLVTPPGTIKSYIKSAFPRVFAAYQNLRRSLTGPPSLETRFTEIYHNNTWNNSESISGRGSTLVRTEVIMTNLPPLLRELRATTLLDAACGDFNWMQHMALEDIKYIGVDIVRQLIERNQGLYTNAQRTFLTCDISQDRLPTADLILCRDCLIHLSFKRIRRTLSNFKRSGAKYLLCTTHNLISENVDCPDGDWRSINLEIAPFNFSKPDRLIVENEAAGKCLGLWRLDKL
jgi:SAM-dependent methyltransferase